MDRLKPKFQTKAEIFLKSSLRPLLLNQSFNGTSSILKVQTASRIRYIHGFITAAAMAHLVCCVVVGIRDDLLYPVWSIAVAILFYRLILIILVLLISLESFCTADFTAMLRGILEVDAYVKSIGSNRKLLVFSWTCSVFIFCDLCFGLFQNYYYFFYIIGYSFWWNNNFVYIMFCVAQCEVILCVVLVRTISEQLEVLGRDLKKVVAIATKNETKVGTIFNFIPRNISSVKIKEIYKNFDKIVEAVECIQKCYAYKILGYISAVFLFQIQRIELVIVYDLYKGLQPWLLVAINAYSFIRYFVPVVVLSFTCEKLYAHVDKMKLSLVHVAIHNDDPETQRVCRLMLHIMRLQPPQLSVLGLFRVDLRLLLRYLAFLATYAVVVLQFSY